MRKALVATAAAVSLALLAGCQTPAEETAMTTTATEAQSTAMQAMDAAQRAQQTAEQALAAAQAAQASADRAASMSQQTQNDIRSLNEKIDRMFSEGMRK